MERFARKKFGEEAKWFEGSGKIAATIRANWAAGGGKAGRLKTLFSTGESKTTRGTNNPLGALSVVFRPQGARKLFRPWRMAPEGGALGLIVSRGRKGRPGRRIPRGGWPRDRFSGNASRAPPVPALRSCPQGGLLLRCRERAAGLLKGGLMGRGAGPPAQKKKKLARKFSGWIFAFGRFSRGHAFGGGPRGLYGASQGGLAVALDRVVSFWGRGSKKKYPCFFGGKRG